MKIIFLVKYYDGFIDSLKNKIDVNLSYQEIHDFVINESSNIFAPFIKEFNRLGHQASIIIPNFKILQQKWCVENNSEFDSDWVMSIAQKQIKKEKPDILFLSSNFEYYGDFLNKVKSKIGKTCAWISCPFDENLSLDNIDHVFTLFKPHYETFKNKGISTTLTHAAFDEDVLQEIPTNKQYDLTFIGGIGAYHKKREKYLKALVKQTPIKIWGYGFRSKNVIKDVIKQLKTGYIYTKAYQGEAWGKDMLNILAKSKITFNVHGDIANGYAVNMRMFEATGCGALLFTEYTKDITNFFEPDKEIICYKSIDDAIKKIKYYLKNDDERKKIALAGQKKTINNYSYKQLAIKYVAIFDKLLNK